MRISISILFIFALLSVSYSFEDVQDHKEEETKDISTNGGGKIVMARFKKPQYLKPYTTEETTTEYTTTYETPTPSHRIYKKPSASYYKQTTTTSSYDEQEYTTTSSYDEQEYTTTYTAPVARKKIYKTKPSYKKPSVPYYKSTSTSTSYDEPETTTSYQVTSRPKIYRKPHHPKSKSVQPYKPKPRYPSTEEYTPAVSNSRYDNDLKKSCKNQESTKCNIYISKILKQAEHKINHAVKLIRNEALLTKGRLGKIIQVQLRKLTKEYSKLVNGLKSEAYQIQDVIDKKLSVKKIADGLINIVSKKLSVVINNMKKEMQKKQSSFLNKIKAEESNIFYNVSSLMDEFKNFITVKIKQGEKARRKSEAYGIKKVSDKLTSMFNTFAKQAHSKCGCSGKQTPYTSSPVSLYNTYEVSNDQDNYTPVKPAKKHVKKHKAPIKKKKVYKPKTTKVANYPADDNSYDDKQPSYENNNNKKYTPVKKNVKKYKTIVKKAPIKKKKQYKPATTKVEPYPAEKQEYPDSYYGKHTAHRRNNKPVRKHNKKHGPRKNAKGYKTSSTTSEDSYDPVRDDDYLKSFYSKHTQKHHLNKKHTPTKKHSYKAPTVEPAVEEDYNDNYHSKSTSLKKPNIVEKIDRSYEQDVDLE